MLSSGVYDPLLLSVELKWDLPGFQALLHCASCISSHPQRKPPESLIVCFLGCLKHSQWPALSQPHLHCSSSLPSSSSAPSSSSSSTRGASCTPPRPTSDALRPFCFVPKTTISKEAQQVLQERRVTPRGPLRNEPQSVAAKLQAEYAAMTAPFSKAAEKQYLQVCHDV
jgi:hypothetical protein